ncbi:MAG: beta-lactamase [Deltaproteobacteria bacterium]|nr:beta-lactamase [Deltaproteobacteria bacterium]
MDRIGTLLDDALDRNIASAAALSIGDAGLEVGRLIRGHTRRLPDLGAPIDDRAWFDLASLTKPIVSVACAMVLVGEGRLDLDTPIRRWIPSASSTGTVRHLLGHAAGCIAHVEFFRTMRVGDHPDPRAELVELAARVPANPPGVTTIYSDLGFLQLGAILERAAGMPLEQAFTELVAGPLGLAARYPGTVTLEGAVATEIDDVRGLVCGRVHDENAYYGGGICGHAGLFATIGDVATFAAAILETHDGRARGRFVPEVVRRFATESAAPDTCWRLGWDTPSPEPGMSHAGDLWPRQGAIGHTGFTGTSLWLDLPRRRWVVLLTNRVHPTRFGTSTADIKALRRAVNDAAFELLERH